MLTCRSIPPERWVYAQKLLLFYFSRRHGAGNAPDLVQDTVAAMLRRSDFVFEHEEDFMRICYGFAAMISRTEYRRRSRGEQSITGFDHIAPEPPNVAGMTAVEMRIWSHQIERIGEAEMRPEDWQLIRMSLDAADSRELAEEMGLGNPNNARVRLFRALGKLRNLLKEGRSEA